VTPEIPDEIQLQLERLEKLGWSVSVPRIDEATFGNLEVRAQMGLLLLRLTQDRGVQSVDLAAENHPGEWFDLALVLEAMGGTLQQRLPSGSGEQLLSLLLENLDRISEMFAPPAIGSTLLRLRQLEQARSQKLFGFSRPAG
jgi:hypothetical protein